MIAVPSQGEISWAEAEDKRRPVLVVTRSEAVPVLTRILVPPVTRTVGRIPTEVVLGAEQGLPDDCVAAFDNLQPIRHSLPTRHVGELSRDQQGEICRALEALADC